MARPWSAEEFVQPAHQRFVGRELYSLRRGLAIFARGLALMEVFYRPP